MNITYVGPVDIIYRSDTTADVYSVTTGQCVAQLLQTPHCVSVNHPQSGETLGRIRQGLWHTYDTSAYDLSDDCFHLLGSKHSIDQAIQEILRHHQEHQ